MPTSGEETSVTQSLRATWLDVHRKAPDELTAFQFKGLNVTRLVVLVPNGYILAIVIDDASVADHNALHIVAQVIGAATSANATLIATPLLPGTPGRRGRGMRGKSLLDRIVFPSPRACR